MTVKFVYKPLENIEKTNTSNQNVSNLPSGKSKFSTMLDSHLQETRSKKESNNSGLDRKAEGRPVEDGDFLSELEDGLEALKGADSEYYEKGIKKKTLAESFSTKNSAELEARIKKYQPIIEAKAKKYGIDPNLLSSLIRQESNFNPYAVSWCGAMGLGQLMPETARYLGVKDPFNAAQNLDGAAKYLSEQLKTFGGSVDKALAAYNAGPGAVSKYNGIPPYRETQNYVRAIKSHLSQIVAMNLFIKKTV